LAFLDEKLGARIDKIKPLTHEEIEKQMKDKAKKLKEKLGLPEDVTDSEVLALESHIVDTLKSHIDEVEGEMIPVEGNIAEKLVNAAEKDDDHDIQAALALASTYHAKSTQHVKEQLSKKRMVFGKNLVEKIRGKK